MTQEELMVGDLVMFNNGVDKVQEIYGKVGNVYLQEYGTIEISRLSPIFLTEEILEKIGFVRFYVNYVNYWKMQVDNSYIELRPTEGNMAIWLDYDKDNDGIYANYILPYPDNLHQLQHALRLCGIEKEIDL